MPTVTQDKHQVVMLILTHPSCVFLKLIQEEEQN